MNKNLSYRVKEYEFIADVYLKIDKLQKENKIILRCCICNTVNVGEGWTGVSPLPLQSSYDHFSHGYCPPCSEIAIAEIYRYYDNVEDYL